MVYLINMLSDISFDNLYKPEPLESFDNKEDIIISLLGSTANGLGAKQLQKVLFLASVEEKKKFPFKFHKHIYGPYSEEVVEVVDSLEKKDLAKKEDREIYSHTQKTSLLSEKGKEMLSSIPLFNRLKEIFENVIKDNSDEYGNLPTGNALEKYCYKQYYLKKDDQNEDWKSEMLIRIKDLLTIVNQRVNDLESIDTLESSKRDLILMSFDYLENLLTKIYESTERDNMDQVLSGVLVKLSEEYADKWGEIIRFEKEENDSQEIYIKKISESKKTFYFLNEFAFQYNFFESIFNN